jgi:hypothetical protein
MSKNNRLTYILIPVVLIVWGVIGWRIFSYGDEEAELDPIIVSDRSMTENKPAVRPRLRLDYQDPFLKVGLLEPRVEEDKETPPVQVNRNIQKPPIIYKGLIAGAKGSVVGLVDYQSQSYLVHQGDAIGSFQIRGIYADSLLIAGEAGQWTYRKE